TVPPRDRNSSIPTSSLLRRRLSHAECSTNFAPGATTFRRKSDACSATSLPRRNVKTSAYLNHVETTLLLVRTPPASHMKPGSCRARTRLRTSAPDYPGPEALPISVPFCAARCNASARSPKISTSSCTHLLTAATVRTRWVIGRLSMTIIIGTLKYFRSWDQKQSPTPLKRSTTLHSRQRQQ